MFNKREFGVVLTVGLPAAVAIGSIGYYFYLTRRNQRKLHVNGSLLQNGSVQDPLKCATELKNRGNALFKEGKFAEAVRAYTEAIESCPSDKVLDLSVFYQNRAAANEKLGLTEQVIADCTAALTCNSKYAKAFARRAKAFEKAAKYTDALYDYTVACYLEGFNDQRNLVAAETLLRTLSQLQARSLLQKRVTDVPLSTSFVEAYMASYCNDPVFNCSQPPNISFADASEGMAKAHQCLRNREYTGILDACNQEITDDGPDKVNAFLLRATFRLMLGKSEDALADFASVFDLCDGDPAISDKTKKQIKSNAYIKRGSLHMQHGRKEEALADLAKAEQTDPENPDVFHHRGQLRILLDDVEAAKDDFFKSLQLREFPISAVQYCYAVYRCANQSGSQLEMEKAMRAFDKTVETYSDCAEGFALLGQALAEQANFAEASQMFDKALKLAPSNATCYVHKGILESQQQASDAGLKTIEKALEIDPYCEFAFETLGTLEAERGNLAKAIDWFDRALDVARTEIEMTHLFTLREGAIVQKRLIEEYGDASVLA